MSRRLQLLLPVLLTAIALPASPALAGEDDGDAPTLREPQGCVTDNRAKITVSGDDIDSVEFFVDGDVVKTVNRPTVRGTFVLSMRCSSLSAGAHRGRAVVTSGDSTQTLRFQITRPRSASPQFTG